MARQVIATKLFVPRVRRGLVVRRRLLDLLQRGAGSRLILVSAPAGFGKTTLLAQWLAEAPADHRGVAWFTIDATDNEPGSFWTHLVAALRTVLPGIGSSALELVDSASSTEPLVITLVNELTAAPRDLWLVLDDYHLVEVPDLRAGVALFLEHVPPHVHVLISSRADPDLPLARWRARGELCEIRAADLRFTFDEAASYLPEATGRHLSATDVGVLEERTEGWIAALQLAAISIRGRDDVGGFVARFAGDDRYVVDYLVEEVLAHQSASVRSFLLQSAVLDRLSGPLCDAVTGRTDSGAMLVELERANLFIVALDDQREWFRYHQLFEDVLRARLLSEQPEQVRQLHQRASAWYELNELTDDAVGHALAASDVDRAAHLMERAVPSIRRDRREAVLTGWLAALPAPVVRRSAVLSAFSGFVHLAAGDLDAVEPCLDDAERVLSAAPDGSAPGADTDELRTLPATIAVYRAALAQARNDAEETSRHAQRALQLAGPRDHLARGAASGFLGLAAWARGDVSTALTTFTRAVASLHDAGTLVDELSSTVVLADLWLVAGRPSKARHLYERALRVADARGVLVARATAELHVGLSEVDCQAGDLESAERHLQVAEMLVERAPMTENRYRWFAAMSGLAGAKGDPLRALELLDQAESFYRAGFLPDVHPIAARRARVWIACGDLAAAESWAAQRGDAATGEVSYLSEFNQLTVVRLLIAQFRERRDPGAIGRADRLLGSLRALAESSGRAGSLYEIDMLQALAADAQGQRERAVDGLARAWAQTSEPDGWVRLFLDEGSPMLDLLRAAERHSGAGDHARRLLTFSAGTATGATEPRRRPQMRATALSERELQVLTLLDSELSGPDIARELFISHNTLRTHTKHIFTKLDVTTRRAAVLRARERGVI